MCESRGAEVTSNGGRDICGSSSAVLCAVRRGGEAGRRARDSPVVVASVYAGARGPCTSSPGNFRLRPPLVAHDGMEGGRRRRDKE